MKLKKINKKLNEIITCIDDWHLEVCGLFVIAAIMIPILILKKGAVFPLHDQLDETILNYIFPARYFGKDTFEAIMCGNVSTEGLKPFAPFFVLFYLAFDEFTAFVLQFFVVIATAFFGTWLCVKKITGSSIAAFLSAAVFTLLPFRSVYGNLLAGTPLLIFCIINMALETKATGKKFLYGIGLVFYAATTSLVLIGYAAIIMTGLWLIIEWIYKKKFNFGIFASCIVLGTAYLVLNLDIVGQVLSVSGVASHREEFLITGSDFFSLLKMYLVDGVTLNDSFHKYIYIAMAVALPLAVLGRKEKPALTKAYFINLCAIAFVGLLSAFLGSKAIGSIKNSMTGMIRSFQAERFYLLLPGLFYVMLGISLALIINAFKNELRVLWLMLALVVYLPTLFYVGKNPVCILYQNVNQINNGSITGYLSWESLYAEDLMEQIDEAIGEDKSTYRVANLGICPVVALYNGFYTIDGYSNNYSLEYKHDFSKIIEKELSLNDFNANYFYNWGNRCYLLYHEWGNAYLIGKKDDVVVNDFQFDVDAMREMNCRFIFSAGEITDAGEKGLSLKGVFETDTSYWRIWVYEL